jgi:hypothetical protein
LQENNENNCLLPGSTCYDACVETQTERNNVQIQSVKKEELALLINGLRSTIVMDQQDLQARLLKRLEAELLQRFGLTLKETA